MVCPPKGLKVDLDNQPLTMTTRPLSTTDAFAHKSAHYRKFLPAQGHPLPGLAKKNAPAASYCGGQSENHPLQGAGK